MEDAPPPPPLPLQDFLAVTIPPETPPADVVLIRMELPLAASAAVAAAAAADP